MQNWHRCGCSVKALAVYMRVFFPVRSNFTLLYYSYRYTLCRLRIFSFRFSKTVYLCKGQCWRSDPSRCPAGNYGSALYVPLEKCAVCSSDHNSCTCVVCQLKSGDIRERERERERERTREKERILNFIHRRADRKKWVVSDEIMQPAAAFTGGAL